ncbi:uncharacterized protein K452DRAFT_296512 [Aplosporella prunicola CBS 121167]|uniref:Rhodopsin domain-containing protein n=1 Tax=Aplosporella prunicola CBS 121167 TaxID=1176127 RepID=A0A6A6BLZ4_9PEZI|nr:uncharacterized protein K452DRAFT_296512 [Aplosporella prunicola CBS 121167]KAF2144315.1 hypothetical protein K452DRAFT_296512 [Aplosporella prunicola CBS 121167]
MGSRGPTIISVTITVWVLALLFVGLRLYTRIVVVGRTGLDDFLMLVATIFATIMTGLMITQVHYGWGQHASAQTVKQMSTTQFVSIWTCIPISSFWHFEKRGRDCINIKVWSIVSATMTTLADIVCFFLPMPLIYKLQLLKRRKFGLFLTFSTGLIPLAASVVRMAQAIQLSLDNGGYIEEDTPYRWALVPFWSEIEVTVGIIAACIPILSPLYRKLLHRMGLREATTSAIDPSTASSRLISGPHQNLPSTGGTVVSRIGDSHDYAFHDDSSKNDATRISTQKPIIQTPRPVRPPLGGISSTRSRTSARRGRDEYELQGTPGIRRTIVLTQREETLSTQNSIPEIPFADPPE